MSKKANGLTEKQRELRVLSKKLGNELSDSMDKFFKLAKTCDVEEVDTSSHSFTELTILSASLIQSRIIKANFKIVCSEVRNATMEILKLAEEEDDAKS